MLTGQTQGTRASRTKVWTSMGRKHCYCSDHLGEIPCWRGQIEIQNESIYRSDNNSMRHELWNHIIALDSVCHLSTMHFHSGNIVGSVCVSRLINKSEKQIRPRAGLFRVVLSIISDKYLPWSAYPFQKLGGMDWTRHNPAFVISRQQWDPHSLQAQDIGAAPRHTNQVRFQN